tara:strand:- start:7738 stop:8292 length:555 start_codon:yes stop_codon:yes gene_type:complete
MRNGIRRIGMWLAALSLVSITNIVQVSAQEVTTQNTELEDKVRKNPTAINYTNLSLAYQKSKQYDKAQKAAETAISLNPKYGGGYICLAQSFEKRGNREKAAEIYEKANAKLSNYDPLIFFTSMNLGILGQTNFKERNYQRSLKYFEDSLEYAEKGSSKLDKNEQFQLHKERLPKWISKVKARL